MEPALTSNGPREPPAPKNLFCNHHNTDGQGQANKRDKSEKNNNIAMAVDKHAVPIPSFKKEEASSVLSREFFNFRHEV